MATQDETQKEDVQDRFIIKRTVLSSAEFKGRTSMSPLKY